MTKFSCMPELIARALPSAPALVAAVMFVIAACPHALADASPASPAAVTATAIAVPNAPSEDGGLSAEPQMIKMESGGRAAFLVTEAQADGFPNDVTGTASLTVSDAAVICIEGPGRVRGIRPGQAVLEVTFQEKRTSISVEVSPAPESPPSFVSDVLPILGKQGCNAGACHAKADGQNGFRLSVFAFDPKSDYQNITIGARGRRVFVSNPGESLLLLKATQTVPHEGGARFEKDSDAWRMLAKWIGSGMSYASEREPVLTSLEVFPKSRRYHKGDRQRLIAKAIYQDGSTRDVTDLAQFDSNEKQIATVTQDGMVSAGQVNGQAVIVARFMGLVGDSQVLVPADKLLAEKAYQDLPVRNFIDSLAYARFRELGLFPSALCGDTEFLRRSYLDVTGTLPPADEAAAFAADPDPDKRPKLVDRLLAHPAYADHWAVKWADLLRPNPDRVGVKSVYLLDQWLRDCFRANKPYDEMVRGILTVQGNTHREGPAVIYRDRREPADLSTMFSQLFLGVRLDCAKCHHHPNEKWSQEDFYRMAAFFAPLKQKGGGISAPISGGNETFYVVAGGTLKHPVTGEVMKPRPPDGPELVPANGGADPRPALADWLLGKENPFFAKAAVNRVWGQFFGRGIVDPVDDFRLSNPPSNPALLDALAAEFVKSGYDLKALMRVILTSRLYQLSSEPNESNIGDTRNFSRFPRRRMGAETMADALAQVTGVPTLYPGLPIGARAVEAWTYKIDSRTMDAFGRPNSSSDCPCERNIKPAISQSLHLMNSEILNEKLISTEPGGLIQRLAAGDKPAREIVEELYLTCYSRSPSGDELCIALASFGGGADRRKATEDLLWAMINSAEFVFNH